MMGLIQMMGIERGDVTRKYMQAVMVRIVTKMVVKIVFGIMDR